MTSYEKIALKRKELEEQEKTLNIISEILEKVNSVKSWYGDFDETTQDYIPYESAITEMNVINNCIALIEKAYKL